MARKDLLVLWQKLFNKPASPALRREVIVPILAYRLQEKAYGGLKASVVRQLRALVENEPNGPKQVGFPAMRAKVGTRMVRVAALTSPLPHTLVPRGARVACP